MNKGKSSNITLTVFRQEITPLFSLNQHFGLGDHTSVSSRGYDERLASLCLSLLLLVLYLFIILYLVY